MSRVAALGLAICFLAVSAAAPVAQSAEPEACKTVRLGMAEWTDNKATNAVASVVLRALGYQPTTQIASVAMIFIGQQEREIDVFLGNWMPAQAANVEPYIRNGSIEVIRTNLEGAKFTLAVPRYAWKGGLTKFTDLPRFRDRLDGKIYGIESASNANLHIQQMIADLDLGGFHLVASSETGLLARVAHAFERKDWIVFLGWEPHPMNTEFDIAYLSGGDAWFGPDFGAATVNTLVRAGYSEECPNVAQFLRNLVFSLAMENEIMAGIAKGEPPEAAAIDWLKQHPRIFDGWLENVTSWDGGDALTALKASLGP